MSSTAEPKSELPHDAQVAEESEEIEKSDEASSGHEESLKREEQERPEAPTRTKSHASVNDVSSIPNGGLNAWLQVAGAFSLFFNTWFVRSRRYDAWVLG